MEYNETSQETNKDCYGRITMGALADERALETASGFTRRQVVMGAGAFAAFAAASVFAGRAFAAEGTQPGGDGGTPPDVPSGQGGQGGEPPSGGQPGGEPPSGGAGGPGGADTMTFDYTGTYTGALEADGSEVTSTGESYDATAADQNAALAQNAGTLAISGGTFTKSGDDTNGDNCNFYGCNSIALAVGEGSTIYVDNSTFSATSEGSNGLFATNSGTIFANTIEIDTTAGNSRGLDGTYGGTIVANDVTINTQGDHCAGVATDRGGANISLTDSTITTAGSGSPVLYSTGNIQVNDITGTATGSQIAGMEGLNTIIISNSVLESTTTGKTASDPIADGVIIYQSMSGDAEATTGEAATFQAVNSTLKSAITEGAMFYFTNTSANALLSNTTLDFDSTAAGLIRAAGNDSNNWGTNGSNGATVNFTGLGQTMAGAVVADTTSQLNLYLLEGTDWTGAASIETNSAASTVDTPLNVYVDADSFWHVNGDSEVSNLHVADGGQVVDEAGNPVTIVAGGTTAVSGSSSYTVTVDGTYDTTVETSDINALSSDLIDRSAFDERYGTSTTFTLGAADAVTQADTSGASDAA